MDETWRPLSRRDAPTELDGLHEGVPFWLVPSLLMWIRSRLWHKTRSSRGPMEELSRATLLEMERRVRAPGLRFANDLSHPGASYDQLVAELQGDEELLLDVVDFLVGKSRPNANGTRPNEAIMLEVILSQGGSAWTVAIDAEGTYCLQRRIDATVRSAATEVMTPEDRASKHLRAAWDAVYGRDPSKSEGYREAVRAVEAIGKPVITPNDDVATLGKMIRAFNDAPHKWQIVLTESSKDTTPHEVVLNMLRLLWHGQHDRHGTDDETAALNVSIEEARAALHLALTLVQWFRSGAIARV